MGDMNPLEVRGTERRFPAFVVSSIEDLAIVDAVPERNEADIYENLGKDLIG